MITFNSYGDCESDTKGTGVGRCDINSFGDPSGILLLRKNWFLTAATDDFDEATYKNQLKKLDAFPFLGLYNFEQNTPENEKNTSNTGVLTEVRAGKPQFTFMYDKGSCFHKALYDKRGKERWDLAILFETGILLASNQDASKMVGFDMGMFSVDTFKLVQGTDPQMSAARIQLLDAEQFNLKNEFFTWEQLGFNGQRIDGVLETKVTYPVAPAAGTSVRVKVVGACNVDEPIAGLDDAAKWRIGGTQASPTTINAVAYNSDTDDYTFTLDTALVANDTIQFELYDTDNDYKVVEDSIGSLFKGQAALATI